MSYLHNINYISLLFLRNSTTICSPIKEPGVYPGCCLPKIQIILLSVADCSPADIVIILITFFPIVYATGFIETIFFKEGF